MKYATQTVNSEINWRKKNSC